MGNNHAPRTYQAAGSWRPQHSGQFPEYLDKRVVRIKIFFTILPFLKLKHLSLHLKRKMAIHLHSLFLIKL
ncbi:MAG: hypothetical protein BGO33_04020 [Bacteroidia bacterium 43-41]|nr:MAG: hypothetical protein BGO33_04020 [Bacteroidia bacterium 43-41]